MEENREDVIIAQHRLSEAGSLMQNVEKINRDADYELSGTTAGEPSFQQRFESV